MSLSQSQKKSYIFQKPKKSITPLDDPLPSSLAEFE